MLGLEAQLEESRAYREIKQEGRLLGRKEGLEKGREEGVVLGELKMLDALLAKGRLSPLEHQELAEPLRADLAKLRPKSPNHS